MSLSSLSITGDTKVGTYAVPIVPFVERSHPGNDIGQYQTISAQRECARFSLEELRLADYENEQRGPRSDVKSNMSSSHFAAPVHGDLHSKTKSIGLHLSLLRGSGITVHVGTAHLQPGDTNDGLYETWSLPQSLLSHHSPFLKNSCSRDFKEGQDNQIELPDDDPIVFSLFVEWMYYGKYNIYLSPVLPTLWGNGPSIDARCWVLGDKFLCPEFKNYAMTRLYQQHTASAFSKVITTQDVRYACDNSPANSKLRQFYFAFVVAFFGSPDRLQGTTEDWDELLVEHADIRSLLLRSFRLAPEERGKIKSEKEYLESDDTLSNVFGKLKVGHAGS